MHRGSATQNQKEDRRFCIGVTSGVLCGVMVCLGILVGVIALIVCLFDCLRDRIVVGVSVSARTPSPMLFGSRAVRNP